MRLATYIFDANSHQVPGGISFLHFVRPVPSEMKITKISPPIVLGGPGGMRRGAGGDMRGSEICKFEFEDMDLIAGGISLQRGKLPEHVITLADEWLLRASKVERRALRARSHPVA